MNFRKPFLLIIIILLCLAGVSGVVYLSFFKQDEKIKIAQYGDVFLYIPVYVAQDLGYFKEQGLDTEIFSTGGDDKTYAAVLSGSASFGIADPTFVAIARSQGTGGKVIANIVNGAPFWAITTDSSLESLTDITKLKGKKIATYPAPSTAYTLQYLLQKKGGVSQDIQQLAFGTLIPAMFTSKVDAVIEIEPNVSTAIANGAKIAYDINGFFPNFITTGVMVTDDYIIQNPKKVQKFVSAIQNALELIRKDRKKALAVAVKRFPEVKPEILSNAIDRMISSNVIPTSVYIDELAWKGAAELRIQTKELGDIKYAIESYDMQFATRATSKK